MTMAAVTMIAATMAAATMAAVSMAAATMTAATMTAATMAAVAQAPVMLGQAATVTLEVARLVAPSVAHMAAPTVARMVALTEVGTVPFLMDPHLEVMDSPTIATTLTSNLDLRSVSIQQATQHPPTAEADITMVDSGVMALTLETSRPASATCMEA